MTNKIAYYVPTVLLTLMMLFSAGMYIFNHAEAASLFETLGFPAYIVYPLAVAKILGLIAIWSNVSPVLREWAYAGFFYDFVLALSGHINAGDGEFVLAAVAIALLGLSYFFKPMASPSATKTIAEPALQ